MIVAIRGSAAPAGKILRLPTTVGAVTASVTEIAVAVGGIPHRGLIVKRRVDRAPIAGPPYGPRGLRVSRTRQGATI